MLLLLSMVAVCLVPLVVVGTNAGAVHYGVASENEGLMQSLILPAVVVGLLV